MQLARKVVELDRAHGFEAARNYLLEVVEGDRKKLYRVKEALRDIGYDRVDDISNAKLSELDNALELAKHDPDQALDYLTSLYADRTVLSYVTKIRKALMNDYPEHADMLINSPLYKEILGRVNVDAQEKLAEKHDTVKDIPDVFKTPQAFLEHFSKVMNGRLLLNEKDRYKYDPEIIALLAITLSSRPSEIGALVIDEDGFVSGHLKQRGEDNRYQYTSIIPLDTARLLLDYVQKYQKEHLPSYSDSKRKAFEEYVKREYGIQARDLRTIGSTLATYGIKNLVRRSKKQQEALRHKNIATSMLHYQL